MSNTSGYSHGSTEMSVYRDTKSRRTVMGESPSWFFPCQSSLINFLGFFVSSPTLQIVSCGFASTSMKSARLRYEFWSNLANSPVCMASLRSLQSLSLPPSRLPMIFLCVVGGYVGLIYYASVGYCLRLLHASFRSFICWNLATIGRAPDLVYRPNAIHILEYTMISFDSQFDFRYWNNHVLAIFIFPTFSKATEH